MEAEQSLKSEVEQFQVLQLITHTTNTCVSLSIQGRLTRCAQQCEDECRDLLPTNASQKDMDKVQQHAEACLMKCADDNITRIPQLIARFRQSLGSK